jgi:hypothetical protein
MASDRLDHLDQRWRIKLRPAEFRRLDKAEQPLGPQRGEQRRRDVALAVDVVYNGIDRGPEVPHPLQVVFPFFAQGIHAAVRPKH